jgi:hypothetical protein
MAHFLPAPLRIALLSHFYTPISSTSVFCYYRFKFESIFILPPPRELIKLLISITCCKYSSEKMQIKMPKYDPTRDHRRAAAVLAPSCRARTVLGDVPPRRCRSRTDATFAVFPVNLGTKLSKQGRDKIGIVVGVRNGSKLKLIFPAKPGSCVNQACTASSFRLAE